MELSAPMQVTRLGSALRHCCFLRSGAGGSDESSLVALIGSILHILIVLHSGATKHGSRLIHRLLLLFLDVVEERLNVVLGQTEARLA